VVTYKNWWSHPFTWIPKSEWLSRYPEKTLGDAVIKPTMMCTHCHRILPLTQYPLDHRKRRCTTCRQCWSPGYQNGHIHTAEELITHYDILLRTVVSVASAVVAGPHANGGRVARINDDDDNKDHKENNSINDDDAGGADRSNTKTQEHALDFLEAWRTQAIRRTQLHPVPAALFASVEAVTRNPVVTTTTTSMCEHVRGTAPTRAQILFKQGTRGAEHGTLLPFFFVAFFLKPYVARGLQGIAEQ
jgi:hypothetical protein